MERIEINCTTGDAEAVEMSADDVTAREAEIAAAEADEVAVKPLDEFGRLITLLSLYEGQGIPPCAELVKMRDGLTVDAVQQEFYGWIEAGGGLSDG